MGRFRQSFGSDRVLSSPVNVTFLAPLFVTLPEGLAGNPFVAQPFRFMTKD
jgi:hypothetical protein